MQTQLSSCRRWALRLKHAEENRFFRLQPQTTSALYAIQIERKNKIAMNEVQWGEIDLAPFPSKKLRLSDNSCAVSIIKIHTRKKSQHYLSSNGVWGQYGATNLYWAFLRRTQKRIMAIYRVSQKLTQNVLTSRTFIWKCQWSTSAGSERVDREDF